LDFHVYEFIGQFCRYQYYMKFDVMDK